jgi:hypothetical protein
MWTARAKSQGRQGTGQNASDRERREALPNRVNYRTSIKANHTTPETHTHTCTHTQAPGSHLLCRRREAQNSAHSKDSKKKKRFHRENQVI